MVQQIPRLDYVARTDIGLKRERNEDSCKALVPPPNTPRTTLGALFIAADGVGGMGGGEVASQSAINEIVRQYYSGKQQGTVKYLIEQSLEAANDYVRKQALKIGLPRIGTTLAGMVITPDKRVLTFNVGDSRIYLVRDNRIEQVSQDQSVMAQQIQSGDLTTEAALNDRNTEITQFIGQPVPVEADYRQFTAQDNDIFVLCTDGLWSLVEPNEILDIASKYSAEKASQKLIKLAHERGAPDNITVVIVRLGKPPRSRAFWVRAALIGLVILAIIIAIIFLVANGERLQQLGAGATATIPTATIPTATLTATQLPTDTPVPAEPTTEVPIVLMIETDTPVATLTFTPSQTPTHTNTPTATLTNTATITNTAFLTSTATATLTVTPSPTLTPTITPSLTPTTTATMTASPSFTPTATLTPTLTPTSTPSPTPTPVLMGTTNTASTIREEPVLKFGNEITVVPEGTRLTILQINEDGTWYNIQLENGTNGWIFGALVSVDISSMLPTVVPTTTATPTLDNIATQTITPTLTFQADSQAMLLVDTSLYPTCDTSQPEIGVLEQGQIVILLEPDPSGDMWVVRSAGANRTLKGCVSVDNLWLLPPRS